MKVFSSLSRNRMMMAVCFLMMIVGGGRMWGVTTTNLWNNTRGTEINWSSSPITIGKLSTTIQAGDMIQVTISSFGSDASVYLSNSAWATMSEVKASNTTQIFVNSLMAEDINTNGFMVRGATFTATSVDLIPKSTTVYDNYLWKGTNKIGSWSNSLFIHEYDFSSAKVGQSIRIHYSGASNNNDSQICLQNTDWHGLTGCPSLESVTGYYDFKISSFMKNDIVRGGIRINGTNFTVDGVEIVGTEASDDITPTEGTITNGTFDSDATGWTAEGATCTPGNGAIELKTSMASNFTFSQDLGTLTAGYYRLGVQGFQRVGSGSSSAYQSAQETMNAKLYVKIGNTTRSTPLLSLYSEDNYPTSLREAATAFASQKYANNNLSFYTDGSSVVQIGVSGTKTSPDDWIALDNFSLKNYGNTSTDIYLDDQVKLASINATGNLEFFRNLGKSKWYTLCVPFDVAGSDISTVFGEGTQVASFDALTISDGTFDLVFSTKNPQVKANIPCLIKVLPNAITSTKIDHALILAGGASSVTAKSTTNSVVLVGNYDVVGDLFSSKGTSYVLSGDKFYKTVDGVATKLNPFRAYFTTATQGEAKGLSFSIDGDETTDIEGVHAAAGAVKGNVFNLNGQLVRANASSYEGLDKGIYIVNGKKIIIK